MKISILSGLMVGAIIVSGCGDSVTWQSNRVSGPQLGVLVQGNPEKTREQIESSGLEYRALSSNHGLYEVYGASKEQLRTLFPKSAITNNTYIANAIAKNTRTISSDILISNGEKNSFLKNKNDDKEPPREAILKTCNLKATETPRPRMSLGFEVSNFRQASQFVPAAGTVLFGTPIGFSGAGSLNFVGVEDLGLRIRWKVTPPSFSNVTEDIRFGSKLSFEPDSVGAYDILMLVEDENAACGTVKFTLMVTANPTPSLPAEGEKRPTIDLKHFQHLDLVNAKEANEIVSGKGVVIAVLDTGLNYNSPGIRWNLAIDETEKSGANDTDKDENGFLHDFIGWDFINNDNLPYDDEGHGSHVSGISSSHIFGIARNSKILPVKVLDAAGGGSVGSVAAGVLYAVDKGADIINLSLGAYGPEFFLLKQSLEYARSKGVIVVAAAGNGDPINGMGVDLSLTKLPFMPDIEICPFDASEEDLPSICALGFRNENIADYYPAELSLSNLLSVAATDEFNNLTEYSNYSSPQIKIAAPGGSSTAPIQSLATQNAKGYPILPSQGTSMATPLVSGILALLLEVNPSLTPEDLIAIMVESGTPSEALSGKIVSGNVVNAREALSLAENNNRETEGLIFSNRSDANDPESTAASKIPLASRDQGPLTSDTPLGKAVPTSGFFGEAPLNFEYGITDQ